MIKNWYVSGDTHGSPQERVAYMRSEDLNPETALIILGDFGLNFYLDNRDQEMKKHINNIGIRFYAVRGNHEERPENLGIPLVYDEDVLGEVYMEPEYPNIRYFVDGGEYIINGYSVLVIGGAYSLDKKWRIASAREDGWCGWFPGEQLTPEERNEIFEKVSGKTYDFVLSHTAPRDWSPFSIPLYQGIDSTMENWLNEVRKAITIKEKWLFGHYHVNVRVNETAECLFEKIVNLDEFTYWNKYRV